MTWFHSTDVAVLIIASIIALLITLYAWRRRDAPGGLYFSLLMMAVAIWAFTSAAESAAATIPAKITWSKLSYLGVVSVSPLWLLFSAGFSRRADWLTRRRVVALWIVPLLILGLAATNEWHRLIWPIITAVSDTPGAELIYKHGLGVWIHAAYAYTLLALGTFWLIQTALRSPGLYRRQVGALIVGATLPWLGNVLYLFNLTPWPGLDLTPIVFVLTGLAMAWGLYRFQMLDLAPVARDALVENMTDGVFVLDDRNRIVDINPAACRILGCSAAGAVGQPVATILAKWPDLVEHYQAVSEMRAEVAVDATQWLDLRISPLYDRRKKLIGRLIALRDITEHKQVEAELAAQRDFFLQVMNAMANGVTVTDEDSRFEFVNPAYARLVGCSPQDLIGKRPQDVTLPEDHATLLEGRARRLKGETNTYETRLQRADGTAVPVLITAVPRWREGRVVGAIAAITDLTERKQMEQALRESEERSRSLFASAQRQAQELELLHQVRTAITHEVDLSAIFRVAVESFANTLGYTQVSLYLLQDDSPAEAGVLVLQHAMGYDRVIQRIPIAQGISGRVIRTGQPVLLQDVHTDPAFLGAIEGIVSEVCVPLFDHGRAIGVFNVESTHGVTMTENDLRLAAALGEHLSMAIERARLFEAERSARQQAEAHAVELAQRERYLTVLNDINQAAISAPHALDLLQVLADRLGAAFDADGAYIALWDETRQVALPAVASGPLRETYPSFRIEPGEVTMTASVLNAGHALAAEDVFNSPYLGPRLAAQFPARSLLGLPLIADGRKLGAALINYAEPHHFTPEEIARGEQIAGQIALAVAKTQLRAEALQRATNLNALVNASRDGVFLVGLDMRILVANMPALRLLRLPGPPETWVGRSLTDALRVLSHWSRQAAKVTLAEIRRHQNGDQAPNEGEYDISPRTLHWLNLPVQVDDTPLGRLIALRDVTDEHAVEHLRQDMTHMLVHDLRNPLGIVSTALELLESDLADNLPADQRQTLDIAKEQASKMRGLINRILEIGQLERQQVPLNLMPIEMGLLVSEALKSQTPRASAKGLRLESDFSPDLPRAWADVELIGRVLQNLLDNACKFTPPGGVVCITGRSGESQGRPALLVSVSDTGSGIPDEIRGRLFQKFVRGTQKERGSGLGLAFCKLAVEAHGGRIEMESAPGRGTTFTFSLPKAPGG